MDWKLAIKRNRDALVQILANLFGMAGLSSRDDEPMPPMLSAATRRAILAVLRPAESALRRLIVIAARGRTAKRLKHRGALPDFAGFSKAKTDKRPAFALFDRRKRFAELIGPARATHAMPRVSFPDVSERVIASVEVAKPFCEKRLTEILLRRLSSFEHALQNLPGQADRLLRVEERRAPPSHFVRGRDTGWGLVQQNEQKDPSNRNVFRPPLGDCSHNTSPGFIDRLRFVRPHPISSASLASCASPINGRRRGSSPLPPIRPGTPPGWRERSIYPVDDILKECHALARDVMLVPP